MSLELLDNPNLEAEIGSNYRPVKMNDTNEIVAVPAHLSDDEVETFFRQQRQAQDVGSTNADLLKQNPDVAAVLPDFYKKNFETPLKALTADQMQEPGWIYEGIEGRARAFNTSFNAFFGVKNAGYEGQQDEAAAKKYPGAAIAGGVTAFLPAAMATSGLGELLGFGKLAAMAGKAMDLPLSVPMAKAATEAVVKGILSGSLFGLTTETGRQAVEAVRDDKNPDLAKIGASVLDNALIWPVYEVGGLIPSRPVGTATVVGLTYALGKAQGMPESDNLLQSVAMGALHVVMGGGKHEEALDAIRQAETAYVQSKNTQVNHNVAAKIVDDHLAQKSAELIERIKEQSELPEDLKPADNIAKDAEGKPIAVNLTPAESEALKYKTAEEYVASKGTTIYHGSGTKFDAFDDSMRGTITGAKSAKGAIWFTDNPRVAKAYSIYAAETGPVKALMAKADAAEKIARQTGKQSDWDKVDDFLRQAEELDTYERATARRELADVKEAVIDNKLNMLEVDAKGKTPQELSTEGDIDSWLNEQVKEAKKQKKDGLIIKNLDDAVGLSNVPSTHYAIFDSGKIQLKSQLTAEWESAHNKLAKNLVEEVAKDVLNVKPEMTDAEKFIAENPNATAEEYLASKRQMYHQTTEEGLKGIKTSGFKIIRGKAGLGDELPVGINTKTSPSLIRLEGKEQIGAYLSKDAKVKEFENRESVVGYLRNKSDEYNKIIFDKKATDISRGRELDALEKEELSLRKDTSIPDSDKKARIEKLNKLQDELLEKWKKETDDAGENASKIANKILLDEGFDAIYIKEDVGGVFGNQKTDNLIALKEGVLKTRSQLLSDFNAAKAKIAKEQEAPNAKSTGRKAEEGSEEKGPVGGEAERLRLRRVKENGVEAGKGKIKNIRKSPGPVKKPRTFAGLVKQYGYIDPVSAEAAGYPIKSFKENGLLGILKNGGRKIDDLAKEFEGLGHLEEGSGAEGLFNKLKESKGKILGQIQAAETDWEKEYAEHVRRTEEANSPESLARIEEALNEENLVVPDEDAALKDLVESYKEVTGDDPTVAESGLTPSGQIRPELQAPLKTELFQEEGELFKKNPLSSESGQVSTEALEVPAQIIKESIHVFSPKTFVDTKVLDELYKMKGGKDKLEFTLEASGNDIRNAFDKASNEENVAFMDAIKRGEKQSNSGLQAVADMMRSLEDAKYKEVQQYKPTAAYKENHFRMFWKVIPGSPESKGFKGLFRRPLQGTKGFLKQSTLADVSEGIAKGGVPYSYNPYVLWQMHMMDMQAFITANKMFNAMKKMGMVKFIKPGDDIPVGFVKINDSIARKYFPAEITYQEGGESYTVPHQIGEYYAEEGTGRLLNNYLSPDHIRSSALGSSLLALKNITTSLELSLSSFHAMYESGAAMATKIGMGLEKIVGKGDLLSGLKDIATSATAPGEYTATGGRAIKYVASPDEFIKTLEGKQFLKEFPNAKELIDDAFTGGMKFAIHQDYKTNSFRALKDGLKAKEPWAVAMNALPGLNEAVMKPMFEYFIPRLKLGAFFKEMSLAVDLNKQRLADGRITRATLAREVVESIENRFGEMNFDNLFWDRTFKSAMQIVIRSVTWKVGALKNMTASLPDQIKEIRRAVEAGDRPLLSRNFGYLLGVATLIAASSQIIQRLSIGEPPQDFKDTIAPRYNPDGDRIMLNTHLKDWIHVLHSPAGFAASSAAGYIGKLIDLWNNKDFYGTEIVHADDPVAQKAWDAAKFLFPTPFSMSQYKRVSDLQASAPIKAATALGITNPAPGYISRTPAEQKASEILASHQEVGARTKAEFEKSNLKRELRIKFEKSGDSSEIEDAISSGKITKREGRYIIKNAGTPKLERMTTRMTPDEVAEVIEKAGDKERQALLPIFEKKIRSKMSNASENEQANLIRLKDAVLKKYGSKK